MSPAAAPEASEAARYFQSVEEHFARLRGTPLVLSPADWQLAASWHQRRIPLPVVLRSITQVFETSAARGRRRPVLSLSYCRHAVEEEFARHLEAAVGATMQSGTAPAHPAPGERLRRKADVLDAAAPASLAGAASALRAAAQEVREIAARLLAGDLEPMAAEARLAACEQCLLAGILRSLAPDTRRSLEAACDARLGDSRKRMAAEIFRRTRQLVLEGEVRKRLGLPRLSLLAD